tara:strand:+ start:93733 stop:94863 length:1131 start_codon:yes stop_codon:yes gene_type:complete
MSKPLVVHIIDRLPPDGAERLLCELLRYRSDDFRYQVLCLVEGGEFESVIRAMGVPIHILGKKPGVDFLMLFRLWCWLRRERPTIVHTHLFTADTWGRIAAKLARVPGIFSTVHSVNAWQGSVHRRVDRALAHITTRLIACTQQVAEKLVRVDSIAVDKVVTLTNAVDLERFQNVAPINIQTEFSIPANVPVMAVLGRLEPVKGQGYLLNCLRQLRDNHVKVCCLFIGDGPDKEALHSQVNALQLSDDVFFAGFRRDVPQLLAAIDVLVIPSQWEGLPMALLEAMALARVVVAHDVGGIGDVLRDGLDGLVVPSKDSAALTEALKTVLMDPEMRHAMGTSARKRVEEKYSAKELSACYEALYREVQVVDGRQEELL